MTQTIYTDRSRIETAQHCLRERWLRYHQDGSGLESAAKPLPLAVGGAVHRGLEVLLRESAHDWKAIEPDARYWQDIEDNAVTAAINDLSQYRNALALDPSEALAQASTVAIPDDVLRSQLADSLGLSVEDAGLDSLLTTQASGKAAFDEYLWQEQSALVEGLVRAYARRRLRPLLEEFEVLEVEREGTWELASFDGKGYCGNCHKVYGDCSCEVYDPKWSITFCSRPDALLRSRADNSLYLMSFKTAATWDRRKELDAQHDMQGLSEGVEVERRLGEWWRMLHEEPATDVIPEVTAQGASYATVDFLISLPAPPRILGIRYEYLLKGYRGEDKELSARFGFKVWSQRSHLVRRYRAVSLPQKGQAAFSLGDYCWSFDYLKDDGSETKLYYGHWKSEPVDNVKAWIDRLDDSQEAMSAFDSTVGQEPRAMGWKSAGQALGFTTQHPLDAIFIPPIPVYRSDDDLRDWLEQTEAQEQRVAEAVARVESTGDDEDARRSALNVLFPQSRRACSYPSECVMAKVCYGGEDIRRDPMSTGKFVRRIPNHEPERRAMEANAEKKALAAGEVRRPGELMKPVCSKCGGAIECLACGPKAIEADQSRAEYDLLNVELQYAQRTISALVILLKAKCSDAEWAEQEKLFQVAKCGEGE